MDHILTDGPIADLMHPLLKKQYVQQSDIQHIIKKEKHIQNAIRGPIQRSIHVSSITQVKMLEPPVDNTKVLLYISDNIDTSDQREICFWATMKGYMVINELNGRWNYFFRAEPDDCDPFWLRALETFSALALVFSVMIKPPIKFMFSF